MLGRSGWIPGGKVEEMVVDPRREEARALKKAISEIDFVLPGTLSERYLRCTHAGCHCHDDPPHLHGPYWYWTRKVDNRTVTKMLRPEQVDDYRSWFDNRKRLRDLVHQLEELSMAVIDEDPRTPAKRKAAADRQAV
jgi:hypothetical protein